MVSLLFCMLALERETLMVRFLNIVWDKTYLASEGEYGSR